MSSPFKGFQNTVLEFQVLTDDLYEDEWGNQSPQFEALTVEAMLQVMSNPADQRFLQQYQRIDEDSIALVGHAVIPKILPLKIREEMEARTVFNYRPGRFLLGAIAYPHGREGLGRILEQAEGTRLMGWFTPDR